MLKLALIGKNISHSKSQRMYEELLGTKVDYTLLDYQNDSDIPKSSELLKKFDGISITSPYKKHFLMETSVDENCENLNAVNCLRLQDGNVESTNTDYWAVKEQLDSLDRTKKNKVLILGNGSMSFMTQSILNKVKIPYVIISRSEHGDISRLDLNNYFSELNETKLIINSCSRDFVFLGKLPQDATFWDYNYSFKPHIDSIPAKCDKYIDGLEMLKRQAFHALRFWQVISD